MDAGSNYLAVSALGAAGTANAYHPLARRGPLSLSSFFSGWLTSELPLQTIAAQALASAAFARKGALRSPAGKAGLALNLASWAGLAGLYREAGRVGPILEQALVDELGADYRSRFAPEIAPPADVPITRRQVGRPFLNLRRRYATSRDLSYGEFGRRNQLDIWRRADLPDDAGAPVLLQVHGGAWVVGNKEQQGGPLMGLLAERGWVCAAINYRLSPRASWPDHIIDVKRAIGWVKENIADYGGDPNFVVITGGSAGGHLSSLAALSPNEPSFQPGFEDVDTRVQAAVPFYGVYDFTNRDQTGKAEMESFLAKQVFKSEMADDRDTWDKASPMSWVGPDAPPMFALHGTNDSLVPIEQARAFVEMLRKESSQPVAFAELPHTQHAFEVFGSVRAYYAVRAVDRFLAVIRSDHLSQLEAGT